MKNNQYSIINNSLIYEFLYYKKNYFSIFNVNLLSKSILNSQLVK